MDRYEALQHAVKAHGATLDKGGLLYALHPIAVANRVEANWYMVHGLNSWGVFPDGSGVESAAVVALLHDVLEDTDYVLDPEDFIRVQWNALQLMTHDEADTYFQYIEKIAVAAEQGEVIAALDKLADLSHNLSPARQAVLPEKTQWGLENRYLKARARLWEALGYEWWPV